MKQEFLFLLKLYNKNFLSDDHYIPVSPEFKMLQECKTMCLEHTSLRQVLIFLCETDGRFTTWSLKRVSCCPSDHPREGNMGAQ
jgi:hypothetical protein